MIDEDDDLLVVETPRQHRRVRFTWHGLRGERQAREEVRKAVEADEPIAVIGASNTVTTLALARGLRDLATEPRPLLLVPWATSVELLGEYPGRTFRFCSNNRRLAALLVDCLKARPGREGPARVEMVVDRLDPYSVDLAECFRREVARAYPKAEIPPDVDETATPPGPRFSGRGPLPTEADLRHARAIWREVSTDRRRETWVMLPLQNDPARRMLLALNAAGPGRHEAEHRPLTVVCGDAVGPTTLAWFANQLAFPVWAASAASNHAAERGLPEDVMEQAETVAAILIALDRPGPPPTADALRDALLHPEGGHPPAPFGRVLGFSPSGERLGIRARRGLPDPARCARRLRLRRRPLGRPAAGRSGRCAMNITRKAWSYVKGLVAIVGWQGLMSGLIALAAFGYGLGMLYREYDRPGQIEHEVLHNVLANWSLAPDYLGKNLVDYANDWREPPRPAGPCCSTASAARSASSARRWSGTTTSSR